MNEVRVLHFGSDIDVEAHALEIGHGLLGILMLVEGSSSENDSACVMGAILVDEVLPVSICGAVPNSRLEVIRDVDLVGVDRHLQFVGLTSSKGLSQGSVLRGSGVRYFAECCGKAERGTNEGTTVASVNIGGGLKFFLVVLGA